MHKNPLQNTGKDIKETLFFKIFRGSMPSDPSRDFCAFSASGADSCLPPQNFCVNMINTILSDATDEGHMLAYETI